MKKATVMITLILSCTAMGWAQAPQAFGAWRTYSKVSSSGETITLLQLTSVQQQAGFLDQPAELKLDAVCRNGKLYRIAVESTKPVSERSMNYSGAVATTPVSFRANEGTEEMQNWAVMDDGHTLSPYSELRQGKRNHSWFERLTGADTVVLTLAGKHEENPVQARFATEGISEALASVGCKY